MDFYDTSTLLNINDCMPSEPFIISFATIRELQNIKEDSKKDAEVKANARAVVRYLSENPNKFTVCMNGKGECIKQGFDVTNDNIILSGALYENGISPIIFYTDDLLLGIIARSHSLEVKSSKDIGTAKTEYLGYKEVTLNDEEMAYFYSNLYENNFGCVCNEYLIIRNSEGVMTDKRKWNGESFVTVSKQSFKSKLLGNVKPLDAVQACAFDSLVTNDINLFFGRAGTGKSTIPFSYIIQGLESGKIKKCYVIYHFETLRGAKTLGFLPGSFEEKALGTSSIGGILASKAGDMSYIKRLIIEGKLQIIPTANLRGVEFEEGSAVWITECQDLDPYTIKTIIQRCASGCKQIFEGDIRQSDINMPVSGMKRLMNVFAGNKNFGCIKLKHNYRSEICAVADEI